MYTSLTTLCVTTLLLSFSFLEATQKDLPAEMQKIMHQHKYDHSIWGVYVKDLQSGEVVFDLNSEKLFSPASTTKLFSVAALLNTFGDDYRFKTPVYASGKIENGRLQGNLILVAQGDLTMGGREPGNDTISFTKMDHIIANEVPGVILTKEDPLHGLKALARQVYAKGIKEIEGDILIDDSLFETTEKRNMALTPIMINENLIDIIINPGTVNQAATVTWRPQVNGYTIDSDIQTVAKEGSLDITITSNELGNKILVKGTIPAGQKDIIRTFSIKDPKAFAQAAFKQALKQEGILFKTVNEKEKQNSLPKPELVALWTSPPLSEYAKLILKVSHNLGADLIPLLLASHQGKKTFTEGMLLLGDFVTQEVKLPLDAFVFGDAAGGNENRLTLQGEIQLLEYLHKKPKAQFQHFFDALPILGVDGSLEDFAKKSAAAGKVRAKTGTGVASNLATGRFFLITQALSGYVEGKNGHLLAYMLVVNNAAMPTIDDIFAIFEDQAQLSSLIYDASPLTQKEMTEQRQ